MSPDLAAKCYCQYKWQKYGDAYQASGGFHFEHAEGAGEGGAECEYNQKQIAENVIVE